MPSRKQNTNESRNLAAPLPHSSSSKKRTHDDKDDDDDNFPDEPMHKQHAPPVFSTPPVIKPACAAEEFNDRPHYSYLLEERLLREQIATYGGTYSIRRHLEELFVGKRKESNDDFAMDLLAVYGKFFPEDAKIFLQRIVVANGPHGWPALVDLWIQSHNEQRWQEIRLAALDLLQRQWAIDWNMLVQKGGNTTDLVPKKISNLSLAIANSKVSSQSKNVQDQLAQLLYPNEPRSVATLRFANELNRMVQAAAVGGTTVHAQLSCSITIPTTDQNQIHKPQPRDPPVDRGESVDGDDLDSSRRCYQTNIFFIPGSSSADIPDPRSRLQLPVQGPVEGFLQRLPLVRQAANQFLSQPVRQWTRDSPERIVYVHQAEVAHAVSSQCDVLVSDRATTCHIVALTSCYDGDTDAPDSTQPLYTVAHVDGTNYDGCLESMVHTHVAFHQTKRRLSAKKINEEKKNESYHSQEAIRLDIHMVGGFEDEKHTSQDISSFLFDAMAWLSEEYEGLVTMTIKTCAVGVLNDSGHGCPVARGLGIDLRSGDVFLAKVDADVAGPALQLRSARIWDGSDGKLNVIHTADSDLLTLRPFTYEVFPKLNYYLSLPDIEMIKKTSTSPNVEESDFCDSVRTTLRFMRTVPCTTVFGADMGILLKFKRVGDSNVWARV